MRRTKPQAELIREALERYTSEDKPPLPAGLAMFNCGRTGRTQGVAEAGGPFATMAIIADSGWIDF